MKYTERVGEIEQTYEADTPEEIASLIRTLNPYSIEIDAENKAE
ncbi:hypothetical protein SAMN04487969_102512 [Paenibacillus algorifonticola]|uniref:Uncharacterized protein n=1 Tax=Paenibacillus algorifonticola TaxID=684063 RepID=A0A1I2AIK9_9BACL|nr:hypothetical protein [Paenibacillus algorifonticola]SFE43732.1 hypothetical protein SAMN04487969_102512 [Paenibacillus algorifonticola]